MSLYIYKSHEMDAGLRNFLDDLRGAYLASSAFALANLHSYGPGANEDQFLLVWTGDGSKDLEGSGCERGDCGDGYDDGECAESQAVRGLVYVRRSLASIVIPEFPGADEFIEGIASLLEEHPFLAAEDIELLSRWRNRYEIRRIQGEGSIISALGDFFSIKGWCDRGQARVMEMAALEAAPMPLAPRVPVPSKTPQASDRPLADSGIAVDPNDRDTLQRVISKKGELPEFTIRPDSAATFVDAHTAGTSRTRIVLAEDGSIIAAASTGGESRRVAIIIGVFTDPDHRGKGFASGLCRALAAELIEEGILPVLFYDNPAAGRIYHRMGFRVMGSFGFIDLN